MGLETLIYLLIGATAGFLSGLLGIGGGMVVVPALVYTFSYLGFPESQIMQMAISTSLSAMIFTAGSSAFSHSRQEGFNWNLLKEISPGIVLGAVVGALIASQIPGNDLRKFFAVFALFFGVYFLFLSNMNNCQTNGLQKTPMRLFVSGTLIGTLSSILGLGGGIITVPVLTGFNTNIKTAISTSAITGFLIAVTGGITYYLVGLLARSDVSRMGFLEIKAFLFIGLAAFLTAPLGASFSYKLPTKTLKRIFGAFLIIVGISMFLQ